MKGFKTGTDLVISEYGTTGMKWGISGGAGKSGKLTGAEKAKMRATISKYPSVHAFRKAALYRGASARVGFIKRQIKANNVKIAAMKAMLGASRG